MLAVVCTQFEMESVYRNRKTIKPLDAYSGAGIEALGMSHNTQDFF